MDLWIACKGGKLRTVRKLINRGRDVNFSSILNGNTVLMDAICQGHVSVVQELIRANADVNFTNELSGRTALHEACSCGHASIIKRLIGNGRHSNQQDNQGMTPLLLAIKGGHELVVHELIRADPSLAAVHTANKQDADKRTPLMIAAERGDDQEVRELIRAGASVITKNKWKQTALHEASKGGHASIVKILIEADADINVQDKEGTTPLMYASERGDGQVVDELIKADTKLNVTTKNKWKQTALHEASKGGHASIVEILIKAGTHINEGDEDGHTPLMFAAARGHEEVVHKLIQAAANVSGHEQVVHELIRAAANVRGHKQMMHEFTKGVTNVIGHEQVIHDLIQMAAKGKHHEQEVHGQLRAAIKVRVHERNIRVDTNECVGKLFVFLFINNQDEDGLTALLLAAERGYDLVVHELITAGASMAALIKQKRTVLYLGDNQGRPSCAKTLAETVRLLRAAVGHVYSHEDAVADQGEMKLRATALHLASAGGHSNVVKKLIKAGIDISDIEEANCLTALKISAACGSDGVVRELLRAHSNVNEKIMLWSSAIHWGGMSKQRIAEICSDYEISIIRWSADGYPRRLPSHLNCTQARKVMITEGATESLQFQLQISPLHLAIAGDHHSVVKALIRAGADINEPDENSGTTLLMYAATKGSIPALHELITAGANVNTKDKGQQNALHLASKEGCHDVVKILIEAEISVNEKDDKEGVTPLMLAAGHGHEQVVHQLIRAGATVTVTDKWNDTALHHASRNDHPKCGALLVEAGADTTAVNEHSDSPLDIALDRFQLAVQVANCHSPHCAKHIIAVIGNDSNGKSTLIAALQDKGDSIWKKITNSTNVQDIRQRTTGIEAVEFSSQKYEETLFYDFAGQSQYHDPHHPFLEVILSKTGLSSTLLLLVKATDEQSIMSMQLVRWLKPLTQISATSTPHVMIVGSFLDQVLSREKATEKVLQCIESLPKKLQLYIHDHCLLDCRKPHSEGIKKISTILQRTTPHPQDTEPVSYNLHWVLANLQKDLFKSAISLSTLEAWWMENAHQLLRNPPPLEEVRDDIIAVGHTLSVPKKHPRWIVLDLQAILRNVYSTLFSNSQGKVNQFGLLHCSRLAELFPKLDPTMIQEVLIALEFCIPVSTELMSEETLQLTEQNTGEKEGWLFFPALVSAKPSVIFAEDSDPQQFQWVCWQLRTAEEQFMSAKLLPAIILRLAANHVFTHKLPSVREHCCSVWANGLSWKSTKGVDVAVQISDSSVVQVVARSKEKPERLHQYISTVVKDVIKTTTQESPQLGATSYIVHPCNLKMWDSPYEHPSESLYPVSSIVRCISDGCDYTLSLKGRQADVLCQKSICIADLFGGLSSPPHVQDMDFNRNVPNGAASSSGQERRSVLCQTVHSVGDQRCAMLLRKFVSQIAVERGRALLECLGLSPEAIKMCYLNYPHDVEEAVQSGLNRWRDGDGASPTWEVLLQAMKDANIAVQRIKALREELLKDSPFSSDHASVPSSSSSQSGGTTADNGPSTEMEELTPAQQAERLPETRPDKPQDGPLRQNGQGLPSVPLPPISGSWCGTTIADKATNTEKLMEAPTAAQKNVELPPDCGRVPSQDKQLRLRKPQRSHSLIRMDSNPTLPEIKRFIVHEIATDWRQVARCLGVESSLIEAGHHQCDEDACEDIFDQWLSMECTTRTWHTILRALEVAGHGALAQKLRATMFKS